MQLKRTHNSGELRKKDTGNEVTLNGWVDTRRDLGGVIFIDLRDRYGITQIVFSPQDNADAHSLADSLRSEYVVAVRGVVKLRDEININPNLPTGEIEVRVHELEILSKSDTPPFEIANDLKTNEDLRLRYRYLDLRRPAMQKNMMMRSEAYHLVRSYFHENNFAEIETPILMRSTPEGARDYLVPSRVNPGKFFALPQSPQTYKQILMVAGMDRYFQIAKCFRDEDLRADRQPEFTQIDVEMSFIDEEDIYKMTEGLIKRVIEGLLNEEVKTPFSRITYQEAIETYGSDKPDTRFDLKFVDLSDLVKNSEFRVFSSTVQKGGKVVGFVAPGLGSLGRGVMDRLTQRVKDEVGAGGLIYMKNNEDELYSSVSKFVSDDESRAMAERAKAGIGDLILILAGRTPEVYEQLGQLRLMIARDYNLIDDNRRDLLWVTDFPLLEWEREEGRFYAMHHPFTSPKIEDLDKMESEPENIRARAYDLVMNGNEIGGGSIRIHQRDVQQKMFHLLGIGDEEAQEKFGFLMDAFRFGPPPHGGIALGLDRIIMLLTKAGSIRDVIAFPKNQKAQSLMDNCPDVVDQSQLDDLHIQLKPGIKV